jgi:hypothetical protein
MSRIASVRTASLPADVFAGITAEFIGQRQRICPQKSSSLRLKRKKKGGGCGDFWHSNAQKKKRTKKKGLRHGLLWPVFWGFYGV